MKRTLKVIVTLSLLFAVLLFGAGFFMLSFALRPDFEASNQATASYAYMERNYPYLQPWVDSLKQGNALRDTCITGQEGERLHAIYVKAPTPTPKTAVIVHGYTDNSIRMLMIGYLYNRDLGFNILLPDLHYHGESEGRAIRMGWRDRLDVQKWMEVANTLFGGNTQMVVHGISMGAATTMMVSGEKQPSYVRCFVEDCGYTSVWAQFEKELKEQFHLPAFPLLDVASTLCEWIYGWNFREASALEQVKKSSLPMMFIHGDKDGYVPTWMVHPLYEAKPGEKELWIVPNAEHAVSYRDNQAEYTHRVRAFVGKYIPLK